MAHDPVQPEPFDDAILHEHTREIVLRKTDETRMLTRRTAEHVIAIGEHVLAVQSRLPEMKFSAWLRTGFALTRQPAYNFILVASTYDGSGQTVLQLPEGVLYEPYTLLQSR